MRPLNRTLKMFTSLVLLLFIAACNPFWKVSHPESKTGWLDWDGTGGWSESGGSGSITEAGAPEEAGESLKSSEVMALPMVDAMPTAASSGGSVSEPSQHANLRAGSVNDNQEWDDYLLYRLKFAELGIPVHEIDVSERHIIQVSNQDGMPVLGAHVTIYDEGQHVVAELLTYSDGQALFFPKACSNPSSHIYEVQAEKDGQVAHFTIDRENREHVVVLDTRSATDPIRLDIHFLIDATGSMSDEIQQLKDNMIRISERIHELTSHPEVRFSMTIYRDRGDLFVSRSFDFTPDVEGFTEELRQVSADGGGDYPESLNEGLHQAIHLPEWRIEETISLIFLVADAPPHLDYANDDDYALEVFEAASRGIKIFPLASSGLDDQGEYIFRQLAQITSAKFLFLTYGAGGAPGDETTHHVDDYSVLSLDELVIQLVQEELAHLSEQ